MKIKIILLRLNHIAQLKSAGSKLTVRNTFYTYKHNYVTKTKDFMKQYLPESSAVNAIFNFIPFH